MFVDQTAALLKLDSYDTLLGMRCKSKLGSFHSDFNNKFVGVCS